MFLKCTSSSAIRSQRRKAPSLPWKRSCRHESRWYSHLAVIFLHNSLRFMNTSDIKVSIVMMAYNHEKFIRNAIEGVVKQVADFRFELIVANDHSTDRTEEIVN